MRISRNVLIKKPHHDRDADPRHDTDERIGDNTVLQCELHHQARRTQRLNEGKEPEKETDQNADLRPCDDRPDDGRDVQNRRIHHDERDESIACQSEKDRDPCEQPGNRQLANTHKSLILMGIVLFHTYSSVLILREI